MNHPAETEHPAYEALAESEARLAAILETTVDGIVTIDEKGTILSFNPAAVSVFGYRAEEVLGQPVDMLMPAPYGEEHNSYVRKYLETGVGQIIGIGREVTGLRKDGSVFPMELSVSDVNVRGRRIFCGIIRDITRRKQVAAALDGERNFLSAILNTSAALVVVLDTKARIMQFNKACEAVTGYRFAEVQGRVIWDVLVPPEEQTKSRRVFAQVAEQAARNASESAWLTKEGRLRRIAWQNTCLKAPHGAVEFVVATGIDVTERRRAESALVSISEAVRCEVGQELHDALGQQLTGIALLVKTLENRLGDRPKSDKEVASETSRLVRSAVSEVRRLSHGLYPVELARSGLHDALAELAAGSTQSGGVTCRYRGEVPSPRLETDTALHLYRIAQEATHNAVKHADASSVNLKLHPDEDEMVLIVQDNGHGFDPEHHGGSGIGLMIMRHRAEMIGARLTIQSNRQAGTCLTCRLPRTHDAKDVRHDAKRK